MENEALPLSLAMARDTREIATAWLRHHQDVARHILEAGQALQHARTFNEMREVQAKFPCGTMQSFLDAIVK